MNQMLIDFIGYSAIAINLYSMSSKGEYKLRLVSFVANLIFVVYGSLLGAIPVILGATIAVFLHGFHLIRIKKLSE